MINLNIESKNSSSELQKALTDIGLFVTHYEGELHIDGDADKIAEAQAFISTYDFTAGVYKDVSKRFQNVVQKHLDAEAQVAGYDNILSACSYAGSANSYQAEGRKFLTWRSDVWDYSYAQLTEVQAGNRSLPTVEDFLTELPTRA